jgi:thiamine-phosphate pyrophosphorylase
MADRCLLYYITDRTHFCGDEGARSHALLEKIAEAAAAGVDYVQIREKDLSGRELERLARDAAAVVHTSTPVRTENRELRYGVRTRLLVNSRTDIALAAGADGVHLRSDDIAPHEVRKLLEVAGQRLTPADSFLIAASCHGVDDVFRAESAKTDFAVFAPVFGKRSVPGVGLTDLKKACRAKIPVLALGGVTLENAASCLDAGAAGVAGIRLFQENKIEDVVRALRAL